MKKIECNKCNNIVNLNGETGRIIVYYGICLIYGKHHYEYIDAKTEKTLKKSY